MSEENVLDRLNHFLYRESIDRLIRKFTLDNTTPMLDLYFRIQNNSEFEKFVCDNCGIEDINDPSNPFSPINMLKKEIEKFIKMWNEYVQGCHDSFKRIFEETLVRDALVKLMAAQKAAVDSIIRCYIQLALHVTLLQEKINACKNTINVENEKIVTERRTVIDIMSERLFKLDFTEELGSTHSRNLILEVIDTLTKYMHENSHVHIDHLWSEILKRIESFLGPLKILESEKEKIIGSLKKEIFSIHHDKTNIQFDKINRSGQEIETQGKIINILTDMVSHTMDAMHDLLGHLPNNSMPAQAAEKPLQLCAAEAKAFSGVINNEYENLKHLPKIDDLLREISDRVTHRLG